MNAFEIKLGYKIDYSIIAYAGAFKKNHISDLTLKA